MTEDKMIDKIRKILALTNSPNQAEAEAAMAMASELMTRHKLTMQQIQVTEQPEEEYDRQDMFCGGRIHTETNFIFPVLEKFFFVRLVTSQKVNPKTGSVERTIVFVGQPENIEIAIYTYNFLKNTYYRLWELYRARTGATTKLKRQFYSGLLKGLMEKLQTERGKVEQSMGLVVVEDPGLEDALAKFFNKLSGGKVRFAGDETTKNAGYEQGKKININPGLGTSSNQRNLLK